MKWQKWHAVAAGAAALTIAVVGLRRCGAASPGSAGGGEGDGEGSASAAAAPDGLLGDLYIGTPNASWAKLQRGIGGAAGILPTTLPGVVVALTELDGRLSAELDGTAPIYGALTGDPGDPGLALAIKLVDPRHARAVLLEAEAAPYRAKVSGGMTLLVPPHANDARFALALAANGSLVIARSADDLSRLAPYVTRTLPWRHRRDDAGGTGASSASATLDVPGAALATKVKPALESLWRDGRAYLLAQDRRMRAEHGRPPDFGDPAAIVATLDEVIARRLEIAGDLARARVSIDVTDDAVSLVATLTPAAPGAEHPSRGWMDAMQVGDASAVLALPAPSLVAFSTRDGGDARAAQARDLEKALASALGPRLGDPARLHAALDALASVRGDSVALAVSLEEPAGVVVRSSVQNADAAQRAFRGAVDLAAADPFKDLLRVRDLRFAVEELPGLGRLDVATFEREAHHAKAEPLPDAGAPSRKKAAAATPSTVGVAWTVGGPADRPPTLFVGASRDPAATLRASVSPDRTLADEPSLQRFRSGIGSEAATVLVAQPLRLDPARANLAAAPVGVAIGKHSGDAFVRVDVPDALVREAVRWQMGF